MKLTDTKIQIDLETAGIKKCNSCGLEYPATLDYFYQAKGNTGGLVHACKRCRDNKQYRKKIEELKITKEEEKTENKHCFEFYAFLIFLVIIGVIMFFSR